jgi:hypothetical protein
MCAEYTSIRFDEHKMFILHLNVSITELYTHNLACINISKIFVKPHLCILVTVFLLGRWWTSYSLNNKQLLAQTNTESAVTVDRTRTIYYVIICLKKNCSPWKIIPYYSAMLSWTPCEFNKHNDISDRYYILQLKQQIENGRRLIYVRWVPLSSSHKHKTWQKPLQ